jgi:hypothetical protein
MDKNDIRNKATHKVKNTHYFERYIRLLDLFSNRNESLPEGSYTESHHILPKANDMFPEYEDFKEHPWNEINLTARQHFIAHWILWKAFQGSQGFAFKCFIDQVECKNNQRQNLKVTSRVYEELKLQSSSFMSEYMKGKAAYYDKEGNAVHCRTDDPRVLSGELVSTSKGRKYKPRTEEQRLRTSKALLRFHKNKENQPDVSFYRGIEKVMVPKYSDDYYYYMESNEWTTKCPPERSSFTTAEYNRTRDKVVWSEESRKRVSERLTGKKQPKPQVIKATLGRRNRREWKKGDYDIFIYDKEQDNFTMIDQMFFDGDKHIKVSKHVRGVSKKIINVKTKNFFYSNPDLPRLPDDFVLAKDYLESNKIVTVLNIKTLAFSKMKRCKIDDNHMEIVARNDNRVRIIDNQGKERYIPKEVKELYFS